MSSISSLSGGSASLASLQQSLFTRLDTNNDGTISQDEFVAGRPKGVSADQATALYQKIDTAGTGALTSDQLAQGLAANRPGQIASGSSDLSGSSDNITSGLSSEVMSAIMQMVQQIEQAQQSTGTSADATAATAATSATTASSSVSGPPSAQDIFNQLDTNGDGEVSQAEFVAGRPQGVSADQATALFNSIDTSGTGSINEQQFASSVPTGTQANSSTGAAEGAKPHHHHHGGGGGSKDDSDSTDKLLSDLSSLLGDLSSLSGSASSTTGAQPSASDLFSQLDTNGDGSLSQSEFVSGRPQGVSEDQATALFNSIDTTGSGSITEQQFADSLSNASSATPSSDSTATASDSTSSTITSSNGTDSNTTAAALLQLLQAIQSYAASTYTDTTNYSQTGLSVTA